MTNTRSRPKRWQSRRLYPSNLEVFQQCRRRFNLKVVERRSIDEPISPALAKGNVAHEVLKICAVEWQASVSMPADLKSLVVARLSQAGYATEQAWEQDVAEILTWVKYGLSYLDPYATILGVEQFLHRVVHPDDGSAPVPLGVRIDLLLLRTDGNGQRFIEIIDYKTGRNLDASPFAPVISRFVLKSLIDKQLLGDRFAPVVFTELYLATQHVRTNEMTLERCLADWEEVKRTLTAIAAESTWEPSPSPLCEWCPFNGNGCLPMLDDPGNSLW